jgi:hypothetical protein
LNGAVLGEPVALGNGDVLNLRRRGNRNRVNFQSTGSRETRRDGRKFGRRFAGGLLRGDSSAAGGSSIPTFVFIAAPALPWFFSSAAAVCFFFRQRRQRQQKTVATPTS